jgi:hypothetical protein
MPAKRRRAKTALVTYHDVSTTLGEEFVGGRVVKTKTVETHYFYSDGSTTILTQTVPRDADDLDMFRAAFRSSHIRTLN